jgi:hypothetical protein
LARSTAVFVAVAALGAMPALAQTGGPPAAAPGPAPGAVSTQADPDLLTVPAEPDFTLAALPTSLRLPRGKLAFRLTHRFTRSIGEGSFGDFAGDLFGFDSSARVGLELRWGVRTGTQVAIHRTNDRSLQLMGQHEIVAQRSQPGDRGLPFTLDAIAAVEGLDNLSEEFSGTVGAVLGRRAGERAAFYLEPMLVTNTDLASASTGDDHSVLLGLGARLRVGASRTYIVVEAAPRLAGFDPGVDHVSVAIEKRAGGHVFQVNVSNALGTTFRQIARGGTSRSDWFIGFNLTRKFY